jgi:hypothetical protein
MRLRAKKAAFAGKTRSILPKTRGRTLKNQGGAASFPSAKQAMSKP